MTSLSQGIIRNYVDQALSFLSEYVSKETGFLHVHPDMYKGRVVKEVPTYENFLYALLLLRSKSVANMTHAFLLLEKLLHFQNKESKEKDHQRGNFPVCLTSYPECRDWFLGIKIATILRFIQNDFSEYLSDALRENVEKAYRLAIQSTKRNLRRIQGSAWMQLFVSLLEGKEKQAEKALKHFEERGEWMNPSLLGKLLFLLSTVSPKLNSLQSAFLKKIPSITGSDYSYIGPPSHVYQFGEAPEKTLFDIAMSIQEERELHLKKAPYMTFLDVAYVRPVQFFAEGLAFTKDLEKSTAFHHPNSIMKSFPNWSYAATLKNALPESYPLRVVLKEATIALTCPYGELIDVQEKDGRLLGTVRLLEKLQERAVVLRLFVERKKGVSYSVQGKKASVFEVDSGVDIQIGKEKVTFGCLPNGARFFGSVSFRDRPYQRIQTESSFDWQASIEYVHGNSSEYITFFIDHV